MSDQKPKLNPQDFAFLQQLGLEAADLARPSIAPDTSSPVFEVVDELEALWREDEEIWKVKGPGLAQAFHLLRFVSSRDLNLDVSQATVPDLVMRSVRTLLRVLAEDAALAALGTGTPDEALDFERLLQIHSTIALRLGYLLAVLERDGRWADVTLK